MNNFRNVLIALLAGLLVLSLSTQAAQSTTKTPDAVNLINYEACVKADLDIQIGAIQANNQNGSMSPKDAMMGCKIYLTYKP